MMNSRSLCVSLIAVPMMFAIPFLDASNANAQSIEFIHGGIGGVTNINNGNAFAIDLINGASTMTFINKTGKIITDFHFTWTANQDGVTGHDDKGSDASVYFGSYTPAVKAIDFFNKPGGTGIGNNVKFEISIAGFNANTAVMATPTFDGGTGTKAINTGTAIPELSTMLGFGSFFALGGLAVLRPRYHRKKTA